MQVAVHNRSDFNGFRWDVLAMFRDVAMMARSGI